MSQALLEIRQLDAFYGDFQALFGIDFQVAPQETVAVIGANGAGKSTLLKSMAGVVPSRGEVLSWKGAGRSGWKAHEAVRAGVALVPEGRRLFASLSVEENLRAGAYGQRKGYWTLERVFEIFPELVPKRNNPGSALSGGQQQMVAIGRALMANPDLMLCDEISLGLAPRIVKDIYLTLPLIREQGTALIIVEQDINQALAVSDRIYCLQEGRVSLTGAPDAFTRQQIVDAYFGVRETAA